MRILPSVPMFSMMSVPHDLSRVVNLYLTGRLATTVRRNLQRIIRIHEEQSEAAYRKRHDHQIANRRVDVKRAEIARQERCR
jgi:hypothetical protein